MNIFLCGLPSSGKSTLGKIVATRLHLKFYDTDQVMLTLFNPKLPYIGDLFTFLGEKRFREYEHQIIQSLLDKNALISLGGSTLHYKASKKLILSSGPLIFLDTPLNSIVQRLKQRQLPKTLINIKNSDMLNNKLSYRRRFLKQLATATICTKDTSITDICHTISTIKVNLYEQ